MPNKNYIKGRRKEYKIMNEARDEGRIAFRSAGSHSAVDVCIIDPIEKKIELIQCKPDSMSDNKKQAIEQLNMELNGEFEVTFKVV